MKFGELASHKREKLVISPRHDAWLVENGNPTYSEEAKAFLAREIGKPDRKREGTFSASSLDSCGRQQQFKFLGLPQLRLDPRTSGIFQNGTMMHLRWQMAGLTEGWLSQAEVPIEKNEHGLSGTMDGVNYDGSILELKSINSNGYRSVTSFGPKKAHLFQGATYALASGREQVVFIYENKDTQEYIEKVIDRDDLPMQEAAQRAEMLWTATDERRLLEPRGKCIDKEGWEYHSCPFRDRCLKIRSWEEAETHVVR